MVEHTKGSNIHHPLGLDDTQRDGYTPPRIEIVVIIAVEGMNSWRWKLLKPAVFMDENNVFCASLATGKISR